MVEFGVTVADRIFLGRESSSPFSLLVPVHAKKLQVTEILLPSHSLRLQTQKKNYNCCIIVKYVCLIPNYFGVCDLLGTRLYFTSPINYLVCVQRDYIPNC